MRRTLALLVLAACGSDTQAAADAAPADAYEDHAGPLFEPSHIVDVSITMAPADWTALKSQSRTIGSVIEGNCLAQPAPSPFTKFHASITVDGTAFADVSVKKKGFFGSLDPVRPSLKVDFNEYVAGQFYLGLEKLTLNNSRQDPSWIHQCMAYQVFGSAGVIVPRCNFAHVHVNGEDLGVYVDVESIDHRLTRRAYANGNGQLYEGSLSDFRDPWFNTFDPKGDGDRTDIVPLVTAAQNASDATLEQDLAPYLDVDRFITYWATEMLINHWDGYSNDKNNFFVYHDPTTGKLDFIPWGVDATFQENITFGGIGVTGGPVAVAASGYLAYRLFNNPPTKAKFLQRQRDLLTTIWNETRWTAEVDRMESLIAPINDVTAGTGWHAQVAAVRSFIANRRQVLTAALDAGPTWTKPLDGYPCLDVKARVTGTFNGKWGTIGNTNPLGTGSGTMQITINNVTTTLSPVGTAAGPDPNPPAGQPAKPTIQIFGRRASDGHVIIVVIQMPASRFVPRSGIDLGFFDASGFVADYDPVANSFMAIGTLLGSANLTAAATTTNAPVIGDFASNADMPGTPP